MDEAAKKKGPAVTREQLLETARVLEALVQDRGLLAELEVEERKALLQAAGRVSRPSGPEERRLVKAFRKKERKEIRDRDALAVAKTGLRVQRLAPVLQAAPRPMLPGAAKPGEEPELLTPRTCYICKADYRRVHFFYDSMCPACGDFNYEKRSQSADLTGRVALVTGGRVKIGFQSALMLLRAGAKVLVSTRFPRDAAMRFAREPDFASFKDRVQVFGLDLRHTPSVELFCRYLLGTQERLDFIVNNACQTVRRPPGWYAHVLGIEEKPFRELPEAIQPLVAGHEELSSQTRTPKLHAPGVGDASLAVWHGTPAVGLWGSARLSQVPYDIEDATLGEEVFPEGSLDEDLQQVDLRATNSWRLKLADVPTPELLEVHLVNAVAPFVLNSRLKALMVKERTFDKHIVNVSAMEGQFSRGTKTDRHPHTNMAKAALNMMTRTSAVDYAKDGVYMNSVDTGWVTDEDPAKIAARKVEELNFQPPLDIVDGAARILDPIFYGLNTGEHVYGKFLKDYRPTEW